MTDQLYLYFADRPDIDWPIVKIGYTDNVDRRMRELKARAFVVVAGTYREIRALERALHAEYAHLRVRHTWTGREWFYLDNELATEVRGYLTWPQSWNWSVGDRIR